MNAKFSLEPPSFSTPFSSRALMLCVVLGWLILGSMISLSVPRLVHDETMHLEMAKLLVNTGDFKAVLDAESDSATGPMYAVVHAAFSPLTNFEPQRVRWLNLLFAFAGVHLSYLCLRNWLKIEGHATPLYLAAHAFFLSTTAFWVVTGVALTETLTLLCVCGGMLLHPAFRHSSHPKGLSFKLIVSGLLWGLAICNRPLVLPVIPILLVTMLLEHWSWRSMLAFGFASGVLPAFLFGYWGGFSRPSTQVFMEGSIHWEYGAFSFAYVLFMGLIWCPTRFLPLHWKTGVFLLICGAIAWLSEAYYPPSVTLTTMLKVREHEALIGNLMGSALFGLGIYTALRLIYLGLTTKATWAQRSIFAATFILALVPLANKLMFTTRYFMALLPFALLFYLPSLKMSYGLCLRITGAITLSYVCLQGYYRLS